MIKFHLSDDLLLSYSSGTLDEASSLLVATHLALCPYCRTRNSSADSLGGYMLDTISETEVSPSLMASVIARVRDESNNAKPLASPTLRPDFQIPEPLRSYVGGDLSDLKWVRVAPRVQQIMIKTPGCASQARLLLFQSGTSVPSTGIAAAN